MNSLAMWLVLIAFSMGAYARPEYLFNPEGTHFAIYNPDDRAYYCQITLGDGSQFEKILYPKQQTRWYSMRGGYATDCST
jgi:hypothetical protein